MKDTPSPHPVECLKQGWTLYKREPFLLSGATLLALLINMLVSIIPFASIVVYPVLLAGLYLMIIALDKHQTVSISTLFEALPQFLPLALSSIAVAILVSIGFVLLVLPGVYLALAYGFTTLLIVDRKMEFWPAMESSRKTITGDLLNYFLFALLMLGIGVVASIPFGLGLLIALPVCLAAQYRYYVELAGLGRVVVHTQ